MEPMYVRTSIFVSMGEQNDIDSYLDRTTGSQSMNRTPRCIAQVVCEACASHPIRTH